MAAADLIAPDSLTINCTTGADGTSDGFRFCAWAGETAPNMTATKGNAIANDHRLRAIHTRGGPNSDSGIAVGIGKFPN